jgi:hypothetical protein
MEEKHYLIKLLTNTEGVIVPSAEVYDSLEQAQVAYHNILAAYHNAPDVLYAVVEILNYIGFPVQKEIVDHRPAPEPEPEEG